MAKKLKITSKKHRVIKVTSKSYPKLTAEELAEVLGAVIVTDPKEIAKLKKKFRRRP